MPRFAANLTMLFTEWPLEDRFEAAAGQGFRGVEILFPYGLSPEELAARCTAAGVDLVLFNAPPGDWEAGMRGLAALPGKEADFDRSLDRACRYLEVTGCKRLHVMAGIVTPDTDKGPYWETYRRNLAKAAARVAPLGVTVTIEPLNHHDVPGYLLAYQSDAVQVIADVGAANLGLQLDLYHCQIMEGDLARHIAELAPLTRHIQIAGVPGRHEPDRGEIHYPFLFDRLDGLGYAGWVGCEYQPEQNTVSGLNWLTAYQK
ncbi:MAG: hydroxypyruvate isomerase family protein [Alphaproteobacteria bacterium]|nr:hydroxypyruvate isomerase family protein [Alphaproteobacteria bacterium]